MYYPVTRDAYRLFHEGSLALSRMEHNGIRIDTDYVDKTLDSLTRKIADLQVKIKEDKVYKLWRKAWGLKTNLGSKGQLANVVFDRMGFKPKKGHETAKGNRKEDESAFDHVDLPFVKDYFQIEKLKKVRSTYFLGIKRELVDGYVHPVFNLHLARTYRSTSDNPNFQNIPSRNPEIAALIRQCYIPRKGRRILEIDYAGIEVRIAAVYHKDPTMMRYINNPAMDMHRDMASKCFMLDSKQVTKHARYAGKNMFVFPQFYGSFYVDCARAMWEAIDRMKLTAGDGGVSLKEHLKAKGIRRLGDLDPSVRPAKGTFENHIKEVEDYFWNKQFPVYTRWKKQWWDEYKRNGWCQIKTGFVVYGPHGRNDIINYPVQGAAFHCLLWSCIQMQKWLDANNMKCLIIGQIHDSLVFDCPDEELDEVTSMAHKIMTKDIRKHWDWINVPLDVEAEASPVNRSWHEKKHVNILAI